MPEPTAEDTVERATTHLGEPEALFRASPRWQRTKFLLACGLILIGIALNTAWFGFGPAKFNHALIHFFFVLPGIGVVLLYTLWRHRGLRVLIYPQGLLRLQHGQAESFPWDDITAIRWKLDGPDTPTVQFEDGVITSVWFTASTPRFQVWSVWIELTRSDGQTLTLSAVLDDFTELAKLVQERTFATMIGPARESLAEGGTVNFGDDLSANRDGVTSKKVSIRWSDVKTFTLAAKFLSIKKKGSWTSSLTRLTPTISNLHILVAIAMEEGVYTPGEDS